MTQETVKVLSDDIETVETVTVETAETGNNGNTICTPEQAVEKVTALGLDYGKGRKARYRIYITLAEIVRDGGVDMSGVVKRKKGDDSPNALDNLWTLFVDTAATAAGTGHEKTDENVRNKYTAVAHASNSIVDFADTLENRVLVTWNALASDKRKKIHEAFVAAAVQQKKLIKAGKTAKKAPKSLSDEQVLEACSVKAPKDKLLYKMVATQIKALEKLIDPTEPLHLPAEDCNVVLKAIGLLRPMAKEPAPMTQDDAAELAAFRKAAREQAAAITAAAEQAKIAQIKADMEANKAAREDATIARVVAKTTRKSKTQNGATV